MGWDNPPVPWDEFERRLSWRARSAGAPAAGPPPPGALTPPQAAARRRPRLPAEDAQRTDAPQADDARTGKQSGHHRQVTHLPRSQGARSAQQVPWAELHCHSSFSFLDGASQPAELVAEAARRGIEALAITDHDGMYGAAQFAQAAARSEEETGVAVGTIFGAELSLDLTGGHSAGPEGPRAGPRGRGAGPRGRGAGPGGRGAGPRGRSPAAPRAGDPDPAGQHLLVLARDSAGYRRLCQVISARTVGWR